MEITVSFIDHINCVANEIELHTGFRTCVIASKICVDTFIGEEHYYCTEKTVMGDVYRFMFHFGTKLGEYGRVKSIKEKK